MTQLLPRLHFNKPLVTLILISVLGTPLNAQTFKGAIEAYDQQNYSEAFSQFSELAARGHIDALNNLGTLYQTGKGVERSYPEAVRAYKRAAITGHINAAYNLANLTRLGMGTPKNIPEAYAWSIVAARHGASDLIAFRDALRKELTLNEIKQAHELAQKVLMRLGQYEVTLAWMLPSELRNPLFTPAAKVKDPEANRAFSNADIQRDTQGDTKAHANYPTLVKEPKKTLAFESGYKNGENAAAHTAMTPTKENSYKIDGVEIPAGFSPLSRDKSAYTGIQERPTHSESDRSSMTDNKAQSIGGVDIPDGFSLLKRRSETEKQTSTPLNDAGDSNAYEDHTNQYNGQNEPTLAPPPKAKSRTYSTQLGHSSTTIYRPQLETLGEYENATILRPRRVIPIKEQSLNQHKPVSDAVERLVNSLSTAMGTPFDKTLGALIRLNPNAFKESDSGVIEQINPEQSLKIPSKELILEYFNEE